MAYDFAANNYEIGSAIVTTYPLTMACWFYPDTLTSNRTLLSLGSSSGNHLQRIFASSSNVSAQSETVGSASAATTSAAPTTGTWQHATGVFASATDRRAFLNGGSKGTDTVSRIFNAGINRTLIAARMRSGTVSERMDGRLAECCIWNDALTDDDVFALSRGYRPTLIRPEKVVMYVPLVRDVLDFARGVTLTASGSPTVVEHTRRIA